MKLKILKQQPATAADYIVCAGWNRQAIRQALPGTARQSCCECRAPIAVSPASAATAAKKICIPCVMKRDPDLANVYGVTESTVKEISDWLSRMRNRMGSQ